MGPVDVDKSNARAKHCGYKSFVFNAGLHLAHGTVEIAELVSTTKIIECHAVVTARRCSLCRVRRFTGGSFLNAPCRSCRLVHTQILVAAHHKTSPHTP